MWATDRNFAWTAHLAGAIPIVCATPHRSIHTTRLIQWFLAKSRLLDYLEQSRDDGTTYYPPKDLPVSPSSSHAERGMALLKARTRVYVLPGYTHRLWRASVSHGTRAADLVAATCYCPEPSRYD